MSSVKQIALKAVDLGLGSCRVGRFDHGKIRQDRALDKHSHAVVLMPGGIPIRRPMEGCASLGTSWC